MSLNFLDFEQPIAELEAKIKEIQTHSIPVLVKLQFHLLRTNEGGCTRAVAFWRDVACLSERSFIKRSLWPHCFGAGGTGV